MATIYNTSQRISVLFDRFILCRLIVDAYVHICKFTHSFYAIKYNGMHRIYVRIKRRVGRQLCQKENDLFISQNKNETFNVPFFQFKN